MKVRSIELRCFKRFERKALNLADEETGLAKDLVVLIGENGCGKSTILQCIAATLGTATRRLAVPGELQWPGFSLEQASAAWSSPPTVEIAVEFSQEEIDATAEYFAMVSASSDKETLIAPGREQSVKLFLQDGKVTSTSREAYFQCRGRDYALQVFRSHPDGLRVFERVGQVFWYTEQRNALSLTPADVGRDSPPTQVDLTLLRRRLADWYYFHRDIEAGKRALRPGERDIYVEIQDAFAAVFPGRRLDGPAPRAEMGGILSEPWFLLHDGKRSYELAELSGGERAVFPLIIDFANWNIHHSVILIDEIELHLHPPMQQALVRALLKLGAHNQFIITTHSDAIVDVLPDASILRVTD